jgi:site-specific DNA recombinase
VLAESLYRFSRDQDDTAGLFKRLTFAGVNIVTLARRRHYAPAHRVQEHDERPVSEGSRREAPPRGRRGRTEDGKSAGGLCDGYRVVKALNGGTVTTGEREIESAKAAIVERMSASSLQACRQSKSRRT